MFRSTRTKLLEQKRLGRWLAGAGLAGLAALYVMMRLPLGPVWYALVMAAIALFVHKPAPAELDGELEADAEGISWNGSRLASRDEIATAERDDQKRPLVTLQLTSGRAVSLRAPSPKAADKLIEALALSPDRHVARFALPRRSLALTVALAASAVGAIAVPLLGSSTAVATAGGIAGVALLLGAYAAYRHAHRALSVGADGVLLQAGLRLRMLGFEDVEEVELYQAGAHQSYELSWSRIVFHLAGGEKVVVPVAYGSPEPDAANRIARMLHGRILRAKEVAAGEREGGLALELAQRDEDAESWLGRVGALARPAGYRRAEISPERMYRVLEDPRQEASARLGAAAALRVLDEGSRERVRIAAAAVAEPELRLALEELAVAEDEEARVAALRRLAREPVT